jgi:hypothetical protein
VATPEPDYGGLGLFYALQPNHGFKTGDGSGREFRVLATDIDADAHR